MKRCPQCARTYDDAALVCAYDDSPLLSTQSDPYAETLDKPTNTRRAEDELSKEEKELLIAAAQTGDIFLHSWDQGKWINAGHHVFEDPSDPLVAARYIEALDSLCLRGFAKHDEGALYVLKVAGLEMGRKLKAQESET